MFIRSTLAIGLFSLCAPVAFARWTEDLQEPFWRMDQRSGTWCFSNQTRRACLPSEFQLTGFEPGYATWEAPWDDLSERPERYAMYDATSPWVSDDPLSTVVGTSLVSGVRLTELRLGEDDRRVPNAAVIAIDFEEGFTLSLYGWSSDAEALREMARLIAEEWLENAE